MHVIAYADHAHLVVFAVEILGSSQELSTVTELAEAVVYGVFAVDRKDYGAAFQIIQHAGQTAYKTQQVLTSGREIHLDYLLNVRHV